MAKNEKDEVDKISKKIIIWLIIISLSVFFFPFIGTLINHCIGLNIGELYTFGIADRKDFFTVWIALFGAIGIAINIYQNHRRTTNQDMQLIKQTTLKLFINKTKLYNIYPRIILEECEQIAFLF